MNYYGKFKLDLEKAFVYEELVKDYFVKLGWEFIQIIDNSDGDILMLDKKGRERIIEVKSDKQTSTGNIIFEYKAWDKPSGISKTKSNIWVYVFPLLNEMWFIDTKKLKELIKQSNPEGNEGDVSHCYRTVMGGDGHKTRCYLWNREIFKNIIGDGMKIIKRELPK